MTQLDTLVLQGLKRCENRVNIQRSAKFASKGLDNQGNARYPTRASDTCLQRRIDEDRYCVKDAQCDTKCRELCEMLSQTHGIFTA